MSYNQFNLEYLEKEFEINFQDLTSLFENITPVNPSSFLQELLKENIPLALAIHTEKARSEMIVAPILIEMRKIYHHQISLFSGADFNIDPSKGLTGRWDFLISNSPSQLRITAPIFTIVEAKNDNIKSGIAQCIAEMIAAQIFNLQQNNHISCIYGCVTTGSNWKFMKLVEKTVYIDSMEYFI